MENAFSKRQGDGPWQFSWDKTRRCIWFIVFEEIADKWNEIENFLLSFWKSHAVTFNLCCTSLHSTLFLFTFCLFSTCWVYMLHFSVPFWYTYRNFLFFHVCASFTFNSPLLPVSFPSASRHRFSWFHIYPLQFSVLTSIMLIRNFLLFIVMIVCCRYRAVSAIKSSSIVYKVALFDCLYTSRLSHSFNSREH